jgi:hypothetical protein
VNFHEFLFPHRGSLNVEIFKIAIDTGIIMDIREYGDHGRIAVGNCANKKICKQFELEKMQLFERHE